MLLRNFKFDRSRSESCPAEDHLFLEVMTEQYRTRVVHPDHPQTREGRQRLRENLTKMGLGFLIRLPWSISEVSLIEQRAFQSLKRKRAAGIRANPKAWTIDVVAKAYRTPREGKGLLDGETEHRSYVESKFQPGSWRRRNGWLVEHCLDTLDLAPVFAFLIPILNPEKQSRITLALATTIIVSLEGKEQIDWSRILFDLIQDLVQKQIARMEKRNLKFTYLPSYIAHLYWSEDCFSDGETSELLSLFPSVAEQRPRRQPVPEVEPELSSPSASQSDSLLVDQICDILLCTRENVIAMVTELKRALDLVAGRYEKTSEPADDDADSIPAEPEIETVDLDSDSDVPDAPADTSPPVTCPPPDFSSPVEQTAEVPVDSPVSVPAAPTFVQASPLESVAPLISTMHEWSPVEWSYRFSEMVDRAARSRTQILPPLTPPVVRGRPQVFCATYDCPNLLLPVDTLRSCRLNSVEIWSWVYHCRRVFAPFPPPHPDHGWPFSYYAWVGPDGLLVRKSKDPTIEEFRAKLRRLMALKSKSSKGRQQIQWIALLPPIPVSPRLLDAGFGVGRGY